MEKLTSTTTSDLKQRVTRFSVVVTLFGQLAEMTIRVADDFGVDHRPLTIANSALCFLSFPILVVLVFVLLRDWVKTATKSKLTNVNCNNSGDVLNEITGCFCRTTSLNGDNNVRGEYPSDGRSNSFVAAVRENARKGCTTLTNTLKHPAKLFSCQENSDEEDQILPKNRTLYDENAKQGANSYDNQESKLYDSVRQTSNTGIKRPFKNILGRLKSSEKIFRKHFRLSDSNAGASKPQTTGIPKDASSWSVFLEKEGPTCCDSVQHREERESEKISSLASISQGYLSRDSRREETNEMNKTVAGGGLDNGLLLLTNRRNRTFPYPGIDQVSVSAVSAPSSTARGNKSGLKELRCEPELSRSKTVVNLEIHSENREERKIEKRSIRHGDILGERTQVENDNWISACDLDNHVDSHSDIATVEELFHRHFGLKHPATNVSEYMRIYADSRKSESWSESSHAAGTGENIQTAHRTKKSSRNNRTETENDYSMKAQGEALDFHDLVISENPTKNKRSQSNARKTLTTNNRYVAGKNNRTTGKNTRVRSISKKDRKNALTGPHVVGTKLTEEEIFRKYFILPVPNTHSPPRRIK